jgi:hypothetical protein
MAKGGAVQARASSVPVLSKHKRKLAKAKAKKLLRKQASSGAATAPQPAAAAAPPAVVLQKKLIGAIKSHAATKPLANASKLKHTIQHTAEGAQTSSKKRKRDDAGVKLPPAASKVVVRPIPAGQCIVRPCCCTSPKHDLLHSCTNVRAADHFEAPPRAHEHTAEEPVPSKHERNKAKAKAKKLLRKQASSSAPQPATAAAAAPPAVVPQKKSLNADKSLAAVKPLTSVSKSPLSKPADDHTADSGAKPSAKKRKRDGTDVKPPKAVSRVTEHPFPAGQCIGECWFCIQQNMITCMTTYIAAPHTLACIT